MESEYEYLMRIRAEEYFNELSNLSDKYEEERMLKKVDEKKKVFISIS